MSASPSPDLLSLYELCPQFTGVSARRVLAIAQVRILNILQNLDSDNGVLLYTTGVNTRLLNYLAGSVKWPPQPEKEILIMATNGLLNPEPAEAFYPNTVIPITAIKYTMTPFGRAAITHYNRLKKQPNISRVHSILAVKALINAAREVRP